MHETPHTPWWRRAVVYQVYIRSFADGNGDGTGDIAGLRSKLPYLRALGVDGIWVNPWYPSPLKDGGYDVADYRDINPQYGTLDEAQAFIDEANDLGMRVLVDLVPNHTSADHAWFQAALDAGPGSPERERYIFRDGTGPNGNGPPNGWKAVFGGSTWTRVDDEQWYLHLFDPSQPDLNWDNPEVLDEFDEILRFWLDRGVAGFRVDVAHSLIKEAGLPEIDEAAHEARRPDEHVPHPHWDRDEIHDIVRRWRSVLDEYPDTMMVAEAWVHNWDRLSRYLRSDEYHQVFDFEFLESPWDASELRASIDHSLIGSRSVGSIPTWVLQNHDVVRHTTRYGLPTDVVAKEWLLGGDRSLLDAEAGLRRARAGTLLALALPGSAFLYQGEELGLPEVHDLELDDLDDPVWVQSSNTEKGRDGCRVPIPWESDGPSAGFGAAEPWLPQPEGWASYAASLQDGVEGSTLEVYRAALTLRKQVFAEDEDIEWLAMPDGVLGFRRGSGVCCIVNVSHEAMAMPEGEILLASSPLDPGGPLPVDTAVWVRPIGNSGCEAV